MPHVLDSSTQTYFLLFSEHTLYDNPMATCERRIFSAAVGITFLCMLAFFMAGYVTENSIQISWQTNGFHQNNTLSAWLVKAVSNVTHNDNSSSTALPPKPILVLYWTTVFNSREWFGQGTSPLNSCQELVGQCEFTGDHSLLKDSDILLFHMRDTLNLPPHHIRSQKWVFAVMESPIHTFANLPGLQGTFNFTMTYAMSAQVPWVYGRCAPLSPTQHPNYNKTFNYAAKKKHPVAWFVSNCRTPSRRETYVKVLSKHIDVHKYGCGGKYNCPRSKASECNRRLNDDYKFYLSFENSLCRDYVTEKLWKILQINVVPIVLGRANYSAILPPHSYIDVRDFASPRHLADYLKVLNANDTLYNEYFNWRAKYNCGTFQFKQHGRGCDLCRHAVATRGKTEIVKDLVAEWGRDQNCIKPKQYYRGMDSEL